MEQYEISKLREEYTKSVLNEGDLHPDPRAQFERWLADALNGQVMEPNAMTLSTLSEQGRISSRIVLLKGLDHRGFIFYTNYLSKKGRELSINPQASLLFFWPELQRQVRVEGKVKKVSEQESDLYFHSRPKGSKLGAWASEQSSEVRARTDLDDQLLRISQQYENLEEVPRPAHWGGFVLEPDLIEFWQGRENRMHDRLVYYGKKSGEWTVKRLSP